MIDFANELLTGLRSAQRMKVQEVVRHAISTGMAPEQIIQQMLVPSLHSLGKGWEEGRISLTQVYMGGRIAEELISELLPESRKDHAPWGKIVIGTMNDSHGMGQRIIASYLASSGAKVISLGLGVPPEKFVRTAIKEECDLIAISVLMYISALQVTRVRELVEKEKRRIPILVGGAPFNMDRTLWKQVGASAMGSNPSEGIAAAKYLLGLQP